MHKSHTITMETFHLFDKAATYMITKHMRFMLSTFPGCRLNSGHRPPRLLSRMIQLFPRRDEKGEKMQHMQNAEGLLALAAG